MLVGLDEIGVNGGAWSESCVSNIPERCAIRLARHLRRFRVASVSLRNAKKRRTVWRFRGLRRGEQSISTAVFPTRVGMVRHSGAMSALRFLVENTRW
jgi:hypothetical protein